MASFGCGAWAQELIEAAKRREADVPVTAHAATKIEEQAEPAEEALDPLGPWYDSSWELLQGLIVARGHALGCELDEWLGGELIGAAEEVVFA